MWWPLALERLRWWIVLATFLLASLVHTVVAIVFYVRLESRLAREGLAVGVTA